MSETACGARFDEAGRGVTIKHLHVKDPDVLKEARRWTTGERGPVQDDPEMLAAADVTAFVREALLLGARALTATAQTVEARALERLVADVGDKTAEASRQAAEVTARAAKEAAEAVAKVTGEARKAMSEADGETRKELSLAVETTRKQMLEETRRLFGGDSPELLEKLQPVLLNVVTKLEAQVREGTAQLLDRAAKQLDPAEPTSPMARHTAALERQQKQLTERIEKDNAALAEKVDALTSAIKVQEARTTLAKVTPIKGISFEAQVHRVMSGIASGLGDEYEDTTSTTGALPRSKKGDGVLSLSDAQAKVVIEMTDSRRTAWATYLDEAERNRGAMASLGIVRSSEQNAGHSVRVLGQRRVVLAFDPDADDPDLLRTVVLLLRTVAVAAATRTGEAQISTAEERIEEAVAQLERIDAIKKSASTITKSATKIESDCTAISTSIRRLLDQALTALAGTNGAASEPDGVRQPTSGAA